MKEKELSLGRLLALLFLCVGLVAAAPRPAPPTPAPVMHVTPTPAAPTLPNLHLLSLEPRVLIYPFDATGSLTATFGKQIANIFSAQFTHSGHVTVLPVPTDVARASFLTNARSQKADYYISGYATPIGNSASVVVQVVNVQSGVIVYAQTGEIYGVNDALSLALNAHDAVVQLSGVRVDVTTTESATTAPSPAATNGARFNLGGLFSHHAHSTPGPATSPTPQPKPERGVILVSVHGESIPASTLGDATSLLDRDLSARFVVRNGGAAPADLSKAASSLCGTNRENTIATGVLVQQHLGGFRPRLRSVFTLQIWTCFGDVLYHTTQTDFDMAKAISNAVKDYVTGHPANS